MESKMNRSALLALETLFVLFLFVILVINFSELNSESGSTGLSLRPVTASSTSDDILDGLEGEPSKASLALNADQNSITSIGEIEATSRIDGKPKDYESPSSYETKQIIDGIFRPENASVTSGFGCQDLKIHRYDYLKGVAQPDSKPKYFFALNLHEHKDIIPSLLSAIIQTITFLGPSNTFLSIVSRDSKDGTKEILSALKPSLDALHINYSIIHTQTNSQTSSSSSAYLHNLVLSPLTSHPTLFSPSPTILFLSGTPLCPDDLLELIHTRTSQSVDLLCAMDYTDGGLRFYSALKESFWNDSATRARFVDKAPFQVFSCWSGAVAMSAAPLVEKGVRFREPSEKRSRDSSGGWLASSEEAVRLAAEMWENWYRRVAVASSVSLGLDVVGKRALLEAGKVKRKRGYTVENVGKNATEKESRGLIQWRKELPDWAMCGEVDGGEGKHAVWDMGPVVPVTGCQ